MQQLLRQLLAIVILPVTVQVVIPVWIARRYGIGVSLPASPGGIVSLALGLDLLTLGLILFGVSLRRFASEGHGTLAPWDPPKQLVISGPYRYVRNPMIAGVIFILFGEALILRSWPHIIGGLLSKKLGGRTNWFGYRKTPESADVAIAGRSR